MLDFSAWTGHCARRVRRGCATAAIGGGAEVMEMKMPTLVAACAFQVRL